MEKEELYQKVLASRELQVNVPKRFKGAVLSDFDKPVLDKVFEFTQRGGWRSMVIVGNVGTGKTHLACAVALDEIKNQSVIYTTAYSLSQRIIADKGSDFFKNYDLLVIDEIGRSFDTKAEKDRFFDLINYRYENEMPVVLCGNVTPEALRDVVGEAIADRLRENMTFLTLTGKSRRS